METTEAVEEETGQEPPGLTPEAEALLAELAHSATRKAELDRELEGLHARRLEIYKAGPAHGLRQKQMAVAAGVKEVTVAQALAKDRRQAAGTVTKTRRRK